LLIIGYCRYSFLPYTINFEAQEKEEKKPIQQDIRPSSVRKGSVLAPIPNLSSSLQARNTTVAPTPPDSPPNTDDPEDFFLQGNKYTASSETATNHRKLLSLSDPHSPAWGRTTSFVQPPSQAGEPPHPSILKHVKLDSEKQDAENIGAQPPPTSRRRRRMTLDKSQDKFFAHADWTVEKADQGNGGLRNAVNAALEDGSLDHCTWVGTLGMPTDVLCGTQRKQDIEDKLETEDDSLVVFCKDSDFDGHYSHYCKQVSNSSSNVVKHNVNLANFEIDSVACLPLPNSR
jgi:trehalose 6-phosphate synthase complex regulatory subunit